MAARSPEPEQSDPQHSGIAVRWLSADEEWVEFNALAHKLMNMSGDEFIRRWHAGDYDDIADTEGHRHIIFLASFIPNERRAR
jgi:hypothetical protein